MVSAADGRRATGEIVPYFQPAEFILRPKYPVAIERAAPVCHAWFPVAAKMAGTSNRGAMTQGSKL